MAKNILIACEFSGRVRDAFKTRGWNAWSCDILPTDKPGNHIQQSVLPLLLMPWDMLIAFPPCTYLCSSGARWWKDKQVEQAEAIQFFMLLATCHIPKICIENPVGVMSTKWRKPDQTIQPWMFGHGETKRTCLWLKNLPLLQPTNIVSGREARVHNLPPSVNRSKLRSLTYTGVAAAMVEQWG